MDSQDGWVVEERAGTRLRSVTRSLWSGLLLAVMLLTPGCGDCERANTAAETGPKRVAVVNYPLAYFVERLADGQVEISFPAPADEDPAFWQPADAAIREYQRADIILLNGAGYAKWMEHAVLPGSRVVNTSESLADVYRKRDEATTHSHGPEGAHEHGILDFNTWLDPEFAVAQAQSAHRAMAGLLPEATTRLEANMAALKADLEALDGKLRTLAAALGDAPLVGSHPVYGYLAGRYGWRLESVHWEPGEMPTDEQWQQFEMLLTRHPARLMIWEDVPLPEVAERLQGMGIRCVVFRTCGNRPSEGDYMTEMGANVERLKKALK